MSNEITALIATRVITEPNDAALTAPSSTTQPCSLSSRAATMAARSQFVTLGSTSAASNWS